MRQILILFCFLVCIPVMTGCWNSSQRGIVDILSQIQKKYAPDRRIAVFDVKVSRDGKLAVEGETSLVSAFSELDSILKEEYPKVDFRIKLLPSESLDSLTRGIITVSVANLRPTPRHSAELVTQAILGTPVKVLKKEDNWYLIQTPDSYLGWTTESSIFLCTEKGIPGYNNSGRIIYTDLTGTCYESPDENSLPVSDIVAGSILKIIDSDKGFWEVKLPDGRSGYVYKNHCMQFKEWEESCIDKYVSAEHNSGSFDEHPASGEVLAGEIIETAMKYLGLPYLWGGTSSKGLDCSGFTKTVYFMNGIILQRDASQQVLYGDLVDTRDNYDKLEPADLLFFGTHETDSTSERVTHTGIYIGNGEIIHSSGFVKINSLIPGNDNYNPGLEASFIRARRVLTCIGDPGIETVFSHELYK